MSFDPFDSVGHCLKNLSVHLDPLIGHRLAAALNGLPWTVILTELDKAKGKPPKIYAATDLQSQLRMLTERLGGLGFPFDDHSRQVSVLGSELRIVRNRWAHDGASLTTLDAWRANDFAVRLLEQLGDGAAADSATALREAAFVALADEKGIAGHVSTPAPEPVVVTPAPVQAAEPEVRPAAEVLARKNATATPTIGSGRGEFEPWTVVPVGDVSVLDDLPKKAAKEKVRAVASEIVEFEGPVQLERLTQLTAASFGVKRLWPAREKKLVYQIRQTGLLVDPDKFVWPTDLAPDGWGEFRPNDSSSDRPFTAISPVEIANAMAFLCADKPGLTDAELDAATLQTFGRARKTKAFADHLVRARTHLASRS